MQYRLFLVDPINDKKIDITDDCLINENKISKLIEYNENLIEKVQ